MAGWQLYALANCLIRIRGDLRGEAGVRLGRVQGSVPLFFDGVETFFIGT